MMIEALLWGVVLGVAVIVGVLVGARAVRP